MKGYHDSNTPVSIRDLWRTPQRLFDYYDDRFKFGCDFAASSSNALCDAYFSDCDGGAFVDTECRLNEMPIGAVWCNPPYSNISPWVQKCIDVSRLTGRAFVMLLPSDTSVKWFKLAFESCTECHFISGRVAFINEETGNPVSGNNKGSVVFVFDPNSPVKRAVTIVDRNEIMKARSKK